MTNDKSCKLCCRQRELRESHIIPKFVFDWLKESSATGFLRFSDVPNRRVQDGVNPDMLCDDCERLFNRWETQFATRIFHPLNRREAMRFDYEEWLLKFAVSVSWRALTWIEPYDLPELSRSSWPLIAKTLQTWEEFLLDKCPSPGPFEQHMILLDYPESIQNINDFPPNMNRFMIRGCHIDICHGEGHPLYIYVKMGRVTLLGFIGVEHPHQWVGTKIHVKRGTVGGSIKVPIEFLNFTKEQARSWGDLNASISKKQKDVIKRSYDKNQDRAVKSETFDALERDVRFFGKEAVFGEDNSGDKTSS
jgi:hypothetical protein